MSRFDYYMAYDIGDDARRTVLADHLVDLGASRLQRSVFWMSAEEARLIRVRTTADRTIEAANDAFNWYRVCGNCPGVIGHTRSAQLPEATRASSAWIV